MIYHPEKYIYLESTLQELSNSRLHDGQSLLQGKFHMFLERRMSEVAISEEPIVEKTRRRVFPDVHFRRN